MSPQMAPASPFAWADLRGWNLYFLSKVVLAWMGALDLKILPNLLFLGALLIPLRWRWARIARTVVAVPVGVALYYQDTWWPPFRRCWCSRACWTSRPTIGLNWPSASSTGRWWRCW
ncbi:TPA: cellulose biosynthesis protein BcsG [Stenotrophomonas maltophilia]|nr:cellulose biosynthesis protein BcsG [Stenotrophomonas maltophilia]